MERRRIGILSLALVGVLLVVGHGMAQTPVAASAPAQDPWAQGRLTVRPYTMATATQTVQAGEFLLDSFPYPLLDLIQDRDNFKVYVPPQCVGTRRCALLLAVGYNTEWRQAGEKYGIIVLTLPSMIVYDMSDKHKNQNLGYLYDSTGAGMRKIDAALQQILRRFAIDPARIVVAGSCGTSDAAVLIGGKNPDVFSRIVVINGGLPDSQAYAPLEWFDTLHKTQEIAFDNGTVWTHEVQTLLHAGYRVKHISSVRGHGHTWEMYDGLGRWLQESWPKPDPATRTAPTVLPGPLPVLTERALAQLTTFWTHFQQEPDSIRTTARRAHLREVLVPVGEGAERPSTVMVDMAALAVQAPSVAAALKQAGLTAQQHDAYRLALFSALLFLNAGEPSGSKQSSKLDAGRTMTLIKGDSVLPVIKGDAALTKNIAFLMAHPDEVIALRATNIWHTP